MELTNSQLLLLVAFNEAGIRKQEAAALFPLLDEKEIEDILNEIDELVNSCQRIPTEQELMEIMWPILKAKK